tara:strand:- start:167 stop:1849 length:1683 start_codon:yes stop_codon:yes gene_type:complete
VAVFRHTVQVDTGASPANLRELEERSDRLERSLRTVESRAGRVGSASTKLAGALGRVSPELQESAMLVNDLADGLEVAALAGPRLLAILGPVAAAAGVAAGAYFILKGRLDEATASMEESARRATEMAELHLRVRDTALMAAVAEGELTQAEFNRIVAARDAESLFAAQKANQQERINLLNEERAALEARIAVQEGLTVGEEGEGGTSGGILATGFTSDEVQNNLDELNKKLEQNVRATVLAQRQLGILDVGQAKHAENLETVANSTGAATTATIEYTAAVDDAAEAVEQLLFTTQDGLTSEEALFQNATAAIQAARGEISLDEMRLKIGTADLVAQNEIAEAAAQAAFRASQRQAAMSEVAGGLGALTNPGAAIGALGPIGAIVTGLAQVGQLGAQGVEDQMRNLVDMIAAGIKALPEIFIDVLPEIGKVIVTELPRAMFEAMQLLFQELFEKLSSLFGRGDGLLSDDGGLRIFEGTMIGDVGDNIRGAFSRTAASRGRVARADGARRLAMSRAPTAQMMGAPSLTINALGIDDGTQDQFQRRFARYTDPNTGLRGRDG